MSDKKKLIQMPDKQDGECRALEDDGCRWISDLPGGPLAVLPCVCGSPVEIESTKDRKHHRVWCPNCGKETPEVMGGQLTDVLKIWNEMVDPMDKNDQA